MSTGTNKAIEEQAQAEASDKLSTIANGTSLPEHFGETSESIQWRQGSSLKKRGVSFTGDGDAAQLPTAFEPEWEPTICENVLRKDLKHFRKYVSTTATHGVRRMFTGKSKIRRMFWILLFVAVAVGCTYNCSVQIHRLAVERPTRLSVTEERHGSLPFPAITICNINGLRRSVLDDLNATEFVTCAFEVLGFTGTMLANSSEHVKDCKDRYVAEDSVLLNYTILDLFRNAAQEPSRLIVDCSWSGSDEVVSCNHTNFTGVPTNNGYCYQFNGDSSSQLISQGPGQRFAFGVTLNIEQEDYGLSKTAGVYLAIHDPREPPRPLQIGIAIPPSSHAYLDLRHITHTYLGQPYGDCIQSNTPLDFFNDYNIAHCQQNSLFTRVAKECECIDPVAPPPKSRFRHLPQCTLNELGCVLRQFVDSTKAGFDDNCEEACSRVDHEPILSFGSFPSTVHAEELRMMHNSSNGTPYTDEDVRMNFLKISVYFGALIDKHFDQQPAYDGILLLADIGGQLGLFLGISILSATEFFVWIFDEIKDRLLWCKVVRRKMTKKIENKNMYSVNKVALDMENRKTGHGYSETNAT